MNRVTLIDTPTGPVSVMRAVAEQLLKNGVISGDLDGKLTATDAVALKLAVMNGAGVCDFCSAPGPSHSFDVPDFEMGLGVDSTGGWAACDTCAVLIKAGQRKELLQRSMDTLTFSKFTRPALAQLHTKFWKGLDDNADVVGTMKAIVDIIDDKVPTPTLEHTPRETRIKGIGRGVGLTDDEMAHLLDGQVTTHMARKLLDWKHHRHALRVFAAGHAPLANVKPHWQEALDAKFDALAQLTKMIREPNPQEFFTDAVNLDDPAAMKAIVARAEERRALRAMGFADDVRYLRDAQTYSFNAETSAAIREAAQSIPRDTALSSIEAPNTGAGWFWFAEPLRLTASSLISDHVHALLWSWIPAGTFQANTGSFEHEGGIVFSAYVIDERGRFTKAGSPSPSTRFVWLFNDSLDEMLVSNGKAWDHDYAHSAEPYVMKRDDTLAAVGELALFFAMACCWFRQTVSVSGAVKKPSVLTRESGHIERHARKRLQREHKLHEPPMVQVVALRKSERVDSGDAPVERQASAREYHCRWIVAGHPRNQPCGPGRKDKKLIWIEPHPAGPADKPLRTREKVYAVIR